MSPEFHVFLLALEEALWRRHELAAKHGERKIQVMLAALLAAIAEARKKV